MQQALLLTVSLLALGGLSAAADPELGIDVTLPVECDRKTKNGDSISVHYRGTLQSNGQKFDASYDRNSPFKFKLGGGQVIKGWDQGLLDMCIGEKRTLTVPPNLGYGQRSMGPIPAGSTLIFETELIGIDGVPKPESIKTKAVTSSAKSAASSAADKASSAASSAASGASSVASDKGSSAASAASDKASSASSVASDKASSASSAASGKASSASSAVSDKASSASSAASDKVSSASSAVSDKAASTASSASSAASSGASSAASQASSAVADRIKSRVSEAAEFAKTVLADNDDAVEHNEL